MKKLIKLTGCLALAAIMGLSSCVKTEVAPEVAQIRQAQVAMLNAQVAQILANVSSTNAGTRYTKMNLYFDSLASVIDHQRDLQQFATWSALDKATLEQTLLEFDKRALQEERNIIDAQQQLAQSTATYERFINQGVFQQNVSDLLGKYSNELHVLDALYLNRIQLTKDIATEQLKLEASTSVSWDYLKSIIEVQITDKEAQLAAAEAALAALQGVYDDPASLDQAKTDLAIQIKDLEDEKLALDVAVQEATNVKTAATAAISAADAVILLMDKPTATKGYKVQLKEKIAAIATQDATIVTKTTDVTNATNGLAVPTQNLALANADVASATSSNASAVAAYNAKLALWNTANTALNNANNDYDNKVFLQTIAANNLAADPTNPALIAAKTAADAAVAAALTVKTNAATAEGSAATAKNNADAVVTTPGTGTAAVLAAAVSAAGTAQGALNTANTTLATAQAALATALSDKAALQTDTAVLNDNIAFIMADYNAAITNMPTLKVNENNANNALTAANAEVTANTAMTTALTSVHTKLGLQLTDVLLEITTQKTAVQTLMDAIAVLQTSVGQNEYNKAESEGKIAMWTQVLATTEIKITESEAIVAYYKKLLDEAIAAAV